MEKVDGRGRGLAGTSSTLQQEHRWGAPYLTQVALLFRRSLRTRRFEVGRCSRPARGASREAGPESHALLSPSAPPQLAALLFSQPCPPCCCCRCRLQSMKTQDIYQFAAISLLAGLFLLQAGKDDTVLGCAAPTLPQCCFCALLCVPLPSSALAAPTCRRRL